MRVQLASPRAAQAMISGNFSGGPMSTRSAARPADAPPKNPRSNRYAALLCSKEKNSIHLPKRTPDCPEPGWPGKSRSQGTPPFTRTLYACAPYRWASPTAVGLMFAAAPSPPSFPSRVRSGWRGADRSLAELHSLVGRRTSCRSFLGSSSDSLPVTLPAGSSTAPARASSSTFCLESLALSLADGCSGARRSGLCVGAPSRLPQRLQATPSAWHRQVAPHPDRGRGIGRNFVAVSSPRGSVTALDAGSGRGGESAVQRAAKQCGARGIPRALLDRLTQAHRPQCRPWPDPSPTGTDRAAAAGGDRFPS